MLPLVHNTIIRNRSNTMPSSSNRANRSNSTTTISATNDASSTGNQYGVQLNARDSSDCKKLKASKVCMTTNNRQSFLKKRSLTFGSLFSPKSSRSASTNSLHSSLVDETIASVLRSVQLTEFLNESNKTVSELNLNQQRSSKYSSANSSSLCKASSTNSTLTDENALDNLVHNSFGSDLNINSNSGSTADLTAQSTNELNSGCILNNHSSTPSFPPPSYTPIDLNRLRRPLFLRSQSAPQQCRSTANSELVSFSNSPILENIQEISDATQTLSEVVEEDEEQLEMASRRNSYLNHRFHCRLAHHKEQMVTIPGFNTKEELYERISNAFGINISQVSSALVDL